MPGYDSVIPIALVLLASLLLVLFSARGPKRRTIEEFLYRGNRPIFALSSGIGATMSLSIAFTALIGAGYLYGWHVVFPMVTGAACGVATLFVLSIRRQVESFNIESIQTSGAHGTSYVSLFASKTGAEGPWQLLAFYIFIIASYTLMLAMELSVLRVFLGTFTGIGEPDLTVLVAAILAVCFSYVYIGGFHGVLLTDHFQMYVVSFLGLLLVFSLVDAPTLEFPGPLVSEIVWTPPRFLTLYLGVFGGTFWLALSGIDQWYRTFGTLPAKSARRVVTVAAVLVVAAASCAVLIGSAARNLIAPSDLVWNNVSLVVIDRVLQHSSETFRFVFLMTLACAVLTTLDTYLITLQQVYYEFAIRIRAMTPIGYLVEYAVRWKGVRAVSGVLAATALLESLVLRGDLVYSFGVLALTTSIFVGPLLPIAAFARRTAFWRIAGTPALCGSVVLFPFMLFVIRGNVGPIAQHLYAIPAAAVIAVAGGFGGAVVISMWTRRNECE